MAIPAIYNNEVFTKMSSVAKHSFEHASGSFIVKSLLRTMFSTTKTAVQRLLLTLLPTRKTLAKEGL